MMLPLLLCAAALPPRTLPAVVPKTKYECTLTASADRAPQDYLMVPVILRTAPDTILIGYKRGSAHWGDPEAPFELLALNPATERRGPSPAALAQPGVDFQDGEFARFENGDIVCYLDAQLPWTPAAGARSDGAVRSGLVTFRSRDGGRTFAPEGRFGLVDGVQYGYAFAAVTEGTTTWMLAMTFTNLQGGKPLPKPVRKSGSVDALVTHDNGRTWHRVRDLTHEFGDAPLNESAFARCGDGFLVSTRGYDNKERLELTDGEFRLRRQVTLTGAYGFIHSYVGRPRVFERDGKWYLLGRNWTEPAPSPMKLSLFRFDPRSLEIDRHVILDNAGSENVIDGYYAMPYWQPRAGKTEFNIVTYKRTLGRNPDIIRLAFDWDEVR